MPRVHNDLYYWRRFLGFRDVDNVPDVDAVIRQTIEIYPHDQVYDVVMSKLLLRGRK